MRHLLALAAVALLVAGCGGGTDSPAGEPAGTESDTRPEPEPEPEPEPDPPDDEDAVARSACTHFRNVAGDAASGLLTDAELREKLKEVHEDARYADDPEIRRQSEAMLAAVTQGDTQRASEAITAFSAACEDLGS